MGAAFDPSEADAVVAALDALDVPPLNSKARQYQDALQELGKLRGFRIDTTTGRRRAVPYDDLPTEWPSRSGIRLPPWGECRQREYLTALWRRYGSWSEIEHHLRGAIDRQFEKANGLFAFNSILIAVLTFHESWVTATKIAVGLLSLSSALLLCIVLSVWGKASTYESFRDEAAESLWLASKRSVLLNWAISFSFVALVIILISFLWRPTRDGEPSRTAPVFAPVWRIGPFCRGQADAVCSQDASEALVRTVTAGEVVQGLTADSSGDRALQIVIIGTSDRVELTPVLQAQYGSNEGLARARAEHVSQQIDAAWRARALPQPSPRTLILTVGPSIHAPTSPSKRETAPDRLVTVYAVTDSVVPKR